MWAALTGAIIVQLTVALIGRRLLDPSGEGEPAAMLLAYLALPSLAAIVWVWFACVWSERDGWARLGFAWIDRRWLVLAVALGLFSVPATMLISALARPLFGPSSNPVLPLAAGEAWGQPVYMLMLLLGIVVLAPLMEEMVFRGLLFGWLRQRRGLWQAATLAALGHAMMHFDLGALPGLFALFLFLAWIYEYSQNLWVPSIIHGVHNFVVLQLP
jgi:membrane protease YdiL (CAAX protease family)